MRDSPSDELRDSSTSLGMTVSKQALKLSFNPKSWKLWIMIIIFAVGSTLFYISQQPAKGTVKTLSPSDITEPKKEEDASLWGKARQQFAERAIKIGEEEKKTEGYSTYSGKRLSFRYPNSYELKTKESSSSAVLEQVILLGSGITPRKLTVMATKMINAADSLEEVSGVQVRRLKPKTYQEKTLDLPGKKGILFEKKEGGYEKTAFFLEKQILLTIALTSVNRDSALDTDFDFILKELTL